MVTRLACNQKSYNIRHKGRGKKKANYQIEKKEKKKLYKSKQKRVSGSKLIKDDMNSRIFLSLAF